jgi:hypothetical protein
MDKSKLDIAQLQQRNPVAWTNLVQSAMDTDDLTVTAAQAVPLRGYLRNGSHHALFRYLLTLADHSDPIAFICKRTNQVEARFYLNVASQLPFLAPHCALASLSGDQSWIVVDDVPDHFPPHKWTPGDVDGVIHGLAHLHAAFWDQTEPLQRHGIPHFIGQASKTLQELKGEHETYFEEGPAAVISEHAIYNAGNLASQLLEAANGLTVIRDLGGWPGILGESQLSAAADLLDDPVPMLEPLRDLPATLMHGDPSSYHWRLTLFDELRLINWQKAAIGPAIYDLVSFLEQFDLLYVDEPQGMRMRRAGHSSEETMIDGYLLSMSGRFGSRFDARAARNAIPAARCLFVLTNWFPRFAKWFSEMPNKYAWQKVNRMSDERLAESAFQPMITLRPYLAAVFQRFLKAYRTL